MPDRVDSGWVALQTRNARGWLRANPKSARHAGKRFSVPHPTEELCGTHPDPLVPVGCYLPNSRPYDATSNQKTDSPVCFAKRGSTTPVRSASVECGKEHNRSARRLPFLSERWGLDWDQVQGHR